MKQNDYSYATGKYFDVYENLSYFIIILNDIIQLSKILFGKVFLLT